MRHLLSRQNADFGKCEPEEKYDDRVCEMPTDLRTQLCERSKDFIAHSLAVDESTDMMDIAQLTIFIRGVDSNVGVTEEILDIKSMHRTTTGKDIFENVCPGTNFLDLQEMERSLIIHQETLCGKVLKIEHVVSTVTRTVNFIRAKALNHCKFQSFMWEIDSEFADNSYHTEVRWLSWGKNSQWSF